MKHPSLALVVSGIILNGCVPLSADKICIRRACVNVLIADTPAARTKGLMDRQALAGDEGMFFVFPEEDAYAFWMKNMRFPIDIIWINNEFKVVDMETGVEPCGSQSCPSFVPQAKCRYVLEVNAGFAKRHRIMIKDTVKWQHKKP
jgi:uncharacterized membrane protein (UPF0127 family)